MSNLEMQTVGNPSWIEFHGSDLGKARDFYSKVLGWTINQMPMQDGGSYNVIQIGESPVGGFSPMPADHAMWLNYITVADVDATFKAALDAGAAALKEPVSMPGVGRMAVFKDPQGAPVAIITYESMMQG